MLLGVLATPWPPRPHSKQIAALAKKNKKSSPCVPNESDSTKRCYLAGQNEHSTGEIEVIPEKRDL